MISRTAIACLGLSLLGAVTLAGNAFANPQVRSPVDSAGPGGGGPIFASCSTTKVHQAYRLTVCNDGRYTVRGGGLTCSGSFAWRSTFGGVRINLRRAPCGAGTDWSGDTIRCGGFALNSYHLVNVISSNDCLYFPTREAMGEGYGPERVYFR